MSAVIRSLVVEPLRAAAAAKCTALEGQVDLLRQAEAAAIAEVKASGARLPDGYWQQRWAAEQKLAAARGALAAIDDARKVGAGADG